VEKKKSKVFGLLMQTTADRRGEAFEGDFYSIENTGVAIQNRVSLWRPKCKSNPWRNG
jgi:hypothetical protein